VALLEADTTDLLEIVMVHRGRPADGDEELAALEPWSRTLLLLALAGAAAGKVERNGLQVGHRGHRPGGPLPRQLGGALRRRPGAANRR